MNTPAHPCQSGPANLTDAGLETTCKPDKFRRRTCCLYFIQGVLSLFHLLQAANAYLCQYADNTVTAMGFTLQYIGYATLASLHPNHHHTMTTMRPGEWIALQLWEQQWRVLTASTILCMTVAWHLLGEPCPPWQPTVHLIIHDRHSPSHLALVACSRDPY
jgi:hypothetical protein